MSPGIICLIATVAAFMVANIVKAAIKLIRGNGDYHGLIASGGMPSVHTASVASLVTVIGMSEGFGSTIFAFALVFLIIVIYDGTHVRRAAGEQGRALAKILPKNMERPFNSDGHRIVEVSIGCIFGALIGLIVFFATSAMV